MTVFEQAMLAREGVREADWEAALRDLVQDQLALAVLRLSHAVPAMLGDGPPHVAMDLVLPLPAGERLRFMASLRLLP